jgi:hypothetical protein
MAYQVALALTPLHILNSLSLMTGADSSPALVFVIEEFATARQVSAGLGAFMPAGSRVVLLPGSETLRRHVPAALRRPPLSYVTGQIPGVLASLRARRTARRLPVERVLVCADIHPYLQQIAGAIRDRNPGCRIVAVEDGAASYIDELPPALRMAGRFPGLFRRVYGRHFAPQTGLGQFPLLDEAHLLYPEHANAALRRLPLHPLPPLDFPPAQLDALIALFGGDPAAVQTNGAATLICLPHPRVMRPALLERFRAAAAGYAAAGLTVFVKAHPRAAPDSLPALEGQWIAGAVPAELIAARLGSRLRVVISGYSTILYTVRRLSPDAQAVLVQDPAIPIPAEVLALYRAVGVTGEDGAPPP